MEKLIENQMNTIYVIGSINTDLVVTATRLPAVGETIQSQSFVIYSGGKGANQAVAAKKLGGRVEFCCCIGKDEFGNKLQNELKSYGIKSYINVAENVPTGVAIIEVVDGNNYIIVEPGANHCLNFQMIRNCLQTAKKGDILLIQLEIKADVVLETMRYAKGKNLKIILNPAPAQNFDEEMLFYSDYIVPNETELQAITHIADIKEAVHFLHKKVPNVLVTLGDKGCLMYDNDKMQRFESKKTLAVDTTAAGDTFCGALAVGISQGKSLVSAIDFAQTAASITVSRHGAQQSIPYLEELRKKEK